MWTFVRACFSACFNSFVHVFMYAYYVLAAMKVACPWKRKLTQIQMCQLIMYDELQYEWQAATYHHSDSR